MPNSYHVEPWQSEGELIAYNVMETHGINKPSRLIASVLVDGDPRIALLEAYVLQFSAMGPVPSIVDGFEHNGGM